MADDPAMLRLLAATEAAGSKLVIIGDHRQIGAVGQAGASKPWLPVTEAVCTSLQRTSVRPTPMSAPCWPSCGRGSRKSRHLVCRARAGQGRTGLGAGARSDGRRLGGRRRRR